MRSVKIALLFLFICVVELDEIGKGGLHSTVFGTKRKSKTTKATHKKIKTSRIVRVPIIKTSCSYDFFF